VQTVETSIPAQIPPPPTPRQIHLKSSSPHQEPKNPHPSPATRCKPCNPQPPIHPQNPAFHFPSIPQPRFLKLTPSANPHSATIPHRFPLFPPQRLLRRLLSILSCLVNPHRRHPSSFTIGGAHPCQHHRQGWDSTDPTHLFPKSPIQTTFPPSFPQSLHYNQSRTQPIPSLIPTGVKWTRPITCRSPERTSSCPDWI
jgi:hypothetical protein